jgi:phosphoribosyl 1,2-cyclic phosphodiesterase
MLTARVLASSSAGNATLLEDGDRRVLLDAGLTYRELQVALEHRINSLDGVLITHEHLDHARAVRDLLTRARVPVIATEGTLEALGVAGRPGTSPIAPLTTRELLGFWRVLAFPVTHDAREPVGYLVASPTGKALYLTDAGFTRYRFRDVTLALLEANHDRPLLERAVRDGATDPALARRIRANHLSLDGALEVLRSTNLDTIKEVHLLHLSDGHADARAFRERVERATGLPTFVAGHQGGIA